MAAAPGHGGEPGAACGGKGRNGCHQSARYLQSPSHGRPTCGTTVTVTTGLIPRPLYSTPDRHVVILACGHFRVISLSEFGVYPSDLPGILFMCSWCHRTQLVGWNRCWRKVLREFPAPPGAQITT